MTDQWNDRDFPVLKAAVHAIDHDVNATGMRLTDLATAAGVSEDDTFLALRALESAGLLDVRWSMPARAARVHRASGEARRLTGAWPTPETALDRIITALEDIADNTEAEEDTRRRARKILDNLAGAGRQIGISVAAAAITGQLPGAGA